MKTKIFSGSFNSKRNPKYQIPALETKQIQSVPHTQHIRITSLPYLQLQEGDVEELVQVLEAKAVLHGRLSIAEIGGAGRPVPSREKDTVPSTACTGLNYTPRATPQANPHPQM